MDVRTDGQTDGWTDMDKTISLRFWQGIISTAYDTISYQLEMLTTTDL